CVTAVGNRAIKVPVRKCDQRDLFNSIRVFTDCYRIFFRQRLASTFLAVLIWIKSSREVEGIYVVSPVFLDELDQIFAEPGEKRRNCDYRRYPNNDTEHR